MDSTLVIGGPDTDINFGVSLAWVHLRRTTVGLEEHHVIDIVLKELESMSKGED